MEKPLPRRCIIHHVNDGTFRSKPFEVKDSRFLVHRSESLITTNIFQGFAVVEWLEFWGLPMGRRSKVSLRWIDPVQNYPYSSIVTNNLDSCCTLKINKNRITQLFL